MYVGPSSSNCSLCLRDHPRSLVKEPEAKLSPSCSFHLGRGVSPISRDAVQQLCAQLSYIVEWLTQFCFNVGPASQTLAQHWSIIGWRSRVFWDSGTRTAPLPHTHSLFPLERPWITGRIWHHADNEMPSTCGIRAGISLVTASLIPDKTSPARLRSHGSRVTTAGRGADQQNVWVTTVMNVGDVDDVIPLLRDPLYKDPTDWLLTR